MRFTDESGSKWNVRVLGLGRRPAFPVVAVAADRDRAAGCLARGSNIHGDLSEWLYVASGTPHPPETAVLFAELPGSQFDDGWGRMIPVTAILTSDIPKSAADLDPITVCAGPLLYAYVHNQLEISGEWAERELRQFRKSLIPFVKAALAGLPCPDPVERADRDESECADVAEDELPGRGDQVGRLADDEPARVVVRRAARYAVAPSGNLMIPDAPVAVGTRDVRAQSELRRLVEERLILRLSWADHAQAFGRVPLPDGRDAYVGMGSLDVDDSDAADPGSEHAAFLLAVGNGPAGSTQSEFVSTLLHDNGGALGLTLVQHSAPAQVEAASLDGLHAGLLSALSAGLPDAGWAELAEAVGENEPQPADAPPLSIDDLQTSPMIPPADAKRIAELEAAMKGRGFPTGMYFAQQIGAIRAKYKPFVSDDRQAEYRARVTAHDALTSSARRRRTAWRRRVLHSYLERHASSVRLQGVAQSNRPRKPRR